MEDLPRDLVGVAYLSKKKSVLNVGTTGGVGYKKVNQT